MEIHVYLLDLRDTALAPEYERYHLPGNVPSVVLNEIRAAGIVAMEIHRFADRLVMITRGKVAYRPSDLAATPETCDWEKLMGGFQEPLRGVRSGTKWQLADKIFDLSEHDDGKANQ